MKTLVLNPDEADALVEAYKRWTFGRFRRFGDNVMPLFDLIVATQSLANKRDQAFEIEISELQRKMIHDACDQAPARSVRRHSANAYEMWATELCGP